MILKRFFILFLILGLGLSINICSCSSHGPDADLSQGDEIISDMDGDGIPDDEDDDMDGDGVLNVNDCAEADATIFPGTTDEPDANYVDSNCDGVDGDAQNAIWVSIDEGSDSNDGSILEPVKTIDQGIELAAEKDDGQRQVYVVAGTYDEDVLVTDDVSLYGGYSLLSNDLRSRDVAKNQTIIEGQDSDQNLTIDFHEGPVTLDYTLLAEDTVSTIGGFVIYGDAAGLCVVALNSNATFSYNDIYDDDPVTTRNMSLTVVGLIDETTSEDHVLQFEHNRIFMRGTNGLSGGGDTYASIGILAYPAMDAETSLTLNIENNEFDSDGVTNEAIAILAADDDEDPDDDPTSDSRADINLNVNGNSIHMDGLYEAAYGVLAGSNQLGNFQGPSLDNLNYINSISIQNNSFYIDLNGSEAAVGASVALSREDVMIANNTFQIEGTASIVFTIFNFLAETNILNNTFYTNVISNQVLGVGFWTMDTLAGAANYEDKSPKRVVNNIFSMNQTPVSSSCYVSAMLEQVTTSNDSYVNSASPDEVRNNDIYFDTTCSDIFYYVDEDAVSSHNNVTSLSDLNNKVGFRADDPTEVSDNINDDPDLMDPDTMDLSLSQASPCLDTGVTLSDVTTDIVGTARPQGFGVDIGAYELIQ